MRLSFSILFTLAISVSGFSQYQIDWRNAPLNPIPVKYTLNHYQLNGPVKKAVIDDLLGKQILYFNTLGKLDSSIVEDFLGHEKKVFSYDDKGTLINIMSQERYCVSTHSLISIDTNGFPTRFFDNAFKYNQAGFLVSGEFENSTQLYHYNDQNQLSKKETLNKGGEIESTTYYTYSQYLDFVRVEENRVKSTDNNENIWTYKYDTQGHLYSEKNIYDKHGNYLGNNPDEKEAVIEYYED